ncbi:MAG TPA: sugar phosphate isomerase/epimerase family protein [Anaerolineales bacterium]|nr:sugar phosphate isomerase/epimerase family protein [Anaerolineales bacterium]
MKISTATSVYVNFSIEVTIQHVAKAGFDGIDIWGGRPHIYRHDYSPQQLKVLRTMIEDHGLGVPSLMPAFFRYPHSLTSPNEVVRQDSLEYMRQCIDNALELGAQTVLIVPGRRLSEQSMEDAWARLVDSVSQICQYAEQSHSRLAVEPVNRYVSDLVNTASDARKIIEAVEYPDLGMVLDSGHINLSHESPQEAVDLAGDRLYQVHVNDNNGRQQQNLALGEGTFDFESFFQYLAKVDYRGFLTAELGWEYTLDPDPVVGDTANRLHQLIRQAET